MDDSQMLGERSRQWEMDNKMLEQMLVQVKK
jgi:hypothetical protein